MQNDPKRAEVDDRENYYPRLALIGALIGIIAIVWLVGSIKAAAATAASWTWTESYAEVMVVKKVRVPCLRVRPAAQCSVAAAQREIAAFNTYVAACEALPPARRLGCLSSWGGRDPEVNLAHVRYGFPVQRTDCVGAGAADAAGFQFSQFRCKVSVEDVTVSRAVRHVVGRIAVYVSGRATMRWQTI